MPILLKPTKKKNLRRRNSSLSMYERAVAKIQFELFLHDNKLPLRIGIDAISIKDEIRLRLVYEDAGYNVEIVNYRTTTNILLS